MSFSTHRVRIRCIGILVFTAALIALLRWKCVDLVRVKGASMSPLISSSGGWLLIDRRASTLESVTRGDVVVFEESGRSAVKRIVGIAGDSVSLRGGDVWLARDARHATRLERSPETQEAQRMPVFPLAGTRLEASTGFENAVVGDSIEVDLADARECLIGLRRGTLEGPSIHDVGLGEAGLEVNGGRDVSDVRVRVQDVKLKAAKSILEIHHLLSSGSVIVVIHRDGLTVVRIEDSVARRIEYPGVPSTDVTLDTLDGMVRVGIPDGGTTRWIWSEPRNTTEPGHSIVSFRVVGGAVATGPISIDRDVHYVTDSDPKSTQSNQSTKYVPDAHVYVLGDQPAASRDSRQLGCISRMQLRGKVISIF